MALAGNKRARYDYETLETYEAGIELLGLEVKSLRSHAASLEGAYIVVRGGEAFVLNMGIPPYQTANTPEGYDPLRPRKLLLSKSELRGIAAQEEGRGLTIVPIKLYNKGKKVKVEVAVVRGKKQFDKREAIKKRESDRDISRDLKDR